MAKRYPYATDYQFLLEVDNLQLKEQYVKIKVLDFFTEKLIEEIQGKSTSGSININGQSAVRRTGSVSLIADSINYNIINVKNLISINKKIEIEVGITNTTKQYQEYPIIWFPQGIYVIKNASISQNNSGINISLSVSDKMALLSGECGGVIPNSIIFSEAEKDSATGNWLTTEKTVALYDVIKTLVHVWGGEDYSRIIIKDIPLKIAYRLKWTGETPLCIDLINTVLYKTERKIETDGAEAPGYWIYTNDYIQVADDNGETVDDDKYQIFSYGQYVGDTYDLFFYPGNLTNNAGDAVTSVLDKIKNMLGNYEYFYDIYGNFIWQQKQNYLNESNITFEDIDQIKDIGYITKNNKSKITYSFTDRKNIISYSNNPQFGNIKNDFVIWGEKGGASDNKIAIRYHLAIDDKPEPGNYYSCYIREGKTDQKIQSVHKLQVYDNLNTLYAELKGVPSVYGYNKNTFTVFKWVNLNDLEDEDIDDNAKQENGKFIEQIDGKAVSLKTQDWRTELFFKGLYNNDNNNKYAYYFVELETELGKMKSFLNEATGERDIDNNLPVYIDKWRDDFDIYNCDFYLDFIDPNSEVGMFAVDNIGRRTKTVSNKDVNCLFARPPFDSKNAYYEIGTNKSQETQEFILNNGLVAVGVGKEVWEFLVLGGSEYPAYDVVRELLYQSTSYNENISISVIPIFYLEPNNLIEVFNKEACIYGNYEIKSISVPLAPNGNMNISCNKALERI